MHAVAIALVEPMWCWSVRQSLSKAENTIRKHYLLTRHGAADLFYVRMVECFQLQTPVLIHTASSLGMQMFTKITPFSAQAVAHAAVLQHPHHQLVQEVVQSWTRTFAQLLPLPADNMITSAWFMPAAHAQLLGSKKWCTYALPLPPSLRSRAGLGLTLLQGFLPAQGPRAMQPADLLTAGQGMSFFKPENLESLADCIRGLASGNEALEASPDVVLHLQKLQSTTDNMYLQAHAKSTKAFQMNFLHAMWQT